jgi:beta-glucanase (GH16 family)
MSVVAVVTMVGGILAALAPPAVAGPPATAARTPTLAQDFNRPWTNGVSPDGRWELNGDWVGTGDNLMERSNGRVAHGALRLTSRADSLRGGELQTRSTYGFGYYEVRMKVAKVAGVCQSFFWKAVDYDLPEIDIEFLTGGVTDGSAEDWIDSPGKGRLYVTIHPWQSYPTSARIDLNFNPTEKFHTYGFLWKPTSVTFTVDGVARRTFAHLPPELGPRAAKGYIMANTWTGNPIWGGGPPAVDAVASYDWIRFYAGATAIPPRAPSI